MNDQRKQLHKNWLRLQALEYAMTTARVMPEADTNDQILPFHPNCRMMEIPIPEGGYPEDISWIDRFADFADNLFWKTVIILFMPMMIVMIILETRERHKSLSHQERS